MAWKSLHETKASQKIQKTALNGRIYSKQAACFHCPYLLAQGLKLYLITASAQQNDYFSKKL
jgi:hypothetical protein